MDHYNNNGRGADYKIPISLLGEPDEGKLEEELEKFWIEERDRKPKEYNC